jgi:hypothetical protein
LTLPQPAVRCVVGRRLGSCKTRMSRNICMHGRHLDRNCFQHIWGVCYVQAIELSPDDWHCSLSTSSSCSACMRGAHANTNSTRRAGAESLHRGVSYLSVASHHTRGCFAEGRRLGKASRNPPHHLYGLHMQPDFDPSAITNITIVKIAGFTRVHGCPQQQAASDLGDSVTRFDRGCPATL